MHKYMSVCICVTF